VAATGVLSWKGALKCDEILNDICEEDSVVFNEMTTTDKIKATWKGWVPPVSVGLLSMGAIILGHSLSSKQIAALCLSNSALAASIADLKAKIVEKYGEEELYNIYKERADASVKESIAIDNNKIELDDWYEYDAEMGIITIDPEGSLYYQSDDDIWFRQKSEIVMAAYGNINRDLQRDGCVCKSDYYLYLGFPEDIIPEDWDFIGWSHDNQINELGVAWIEMNEQRGIEVHRYPYMGFKTPEGASYEDYTIIDFVLPPDQMFEEAEPKMYNE